MRPNREVNIAYSFLLAGLIASLNLLCLPSHSAPANSMGFLYGKPPTVFPLTDFVRAGTFVFINELSDFDRINDGEHIAVVYRPGAASGLNSSVFLGYSPGVIPIGALVEERNGSSHNVVPDHVLVAARALGCKSVREIYQFVYQNRPCGASKAGIGDVLGARFVYHKNTHQAIFNLYKSFAVSGFISSPTSTRLLGAGVTKVIRTNNGRFRSEFRNWRTAIALTMNPAFFGFTGNTSNNDLQLGDYDLLMFPMDEVARLVGEINCLLGKASVLETQCNTDYFPRDYRRLQDPYKNLLGILGPYETALRSNLDGFVEFAAQASFKPHGLPYDDRERDGTVSLPTRPSLTPIKKTFRHHIP